MYFNNEKPPEKPIPPPNRLIEEGSGKIVIIDFEELIKKSIPPSFYVKTMRDYLNWCSVSECQKCGLLGKREDFHPANYCPNCAIHPKEKVGRWIKTAPWWKFYGTQGYWETKR